MGVVIRNRLRRYSLHHSRCRGLILRMLRRAGAAYAELSITFIGDQHMRRLNRRYRGIDRPTDVLAFPMCAIPGPASALLGDVVISLHTAARQARTAGH